MRPRQQCGRIDGALSVACCSVLSVACCPLQGCPLRFQYCCELQREMGPLRPVRRVSALEQAVSHCGRVRWRSARLIGRGRRHHAVHLRAAKPPTTNANATPGSVGLFPHRQRQSRRRTHGKSFAKVAVGAAPPGPVGAQRVHAHAVASCPVLSGREGIRGMRLPRARAAPFRERG